MLAGRGSVCSRQLRAGPANRGSDVPLGGQRRLAEHVNNSRTRTHSVYYLGPAASLRHLHAAPGSRLSLTSVSNVPTRGEETSESLGRSSPRPREVPTWPYLGLPGRLDLAAGDTTAPMGCLALWCSNLCVSSSPSLLRRWGRIPGPLLLFVCVEIKLYGHKAHLFPHGWSRYCFSLTLCL